jgi:hypothetical protein
LGPQGRAFKSRRPDSPAPTLFDIAERWLPVVGWEGWYEVSDLGRVRRVKAAPRTRAGYILAASVNRSGYRRIVLSADKLRHTCHVHTLVAAAFLGPKPAGCVVNHRDGCKTNNSPANLEYVTQSENMRHAVREGLAKVPTFAPPRALTPEQEKDVRTRRADGALLRTLAAEFGVSIGTIHRTCNRHAADRGAA